MTMNHLTFRRKHRLKQDDDDRVMPLINIVFLLLIFFMVAGRLSASDPFTIVPPKSANEGKKNSEQSLVLIGEGAQLALDGEIIDRPILLERLAAANADEVRVKVHGAANAAAVVDLIDEMKAAGIKTIHLLTIPNHGDKS